MNARHQEILAHAMANPPRPRPASGPRPAPPAPPPAHELQVAAHLYSWGGYGQVADEVVEALMSSGVPFHVAPLGLDERFGGIAPRTRARIRRHGAGAARRLLLATPDGETRAGDARLTMWETNRLSEAAVSRLNLARVVIVPCEANARDFAASGVTAPIRVVPLGVDAAVFGERPAPSRSGFVVGMGGRLAHGGERKGFAEGIAAFLQAFPDPRDGAELRIRCWEDCLPRFDRPDDPRVTVDTRPRSLSELADWYGGLDVFLSPSKGEGFGLMPLQAMSMGRPVIGASWLGQAEYLDATAGWPVAYDLAHASGFYAGQGQWAVPSISVMAAALREARGGAEARAAKGRAATARAREFTWDRFGEGLAAALRAFGLADAPARDWPAIRRALNCPERVVPECGCQGFRCRAGRGLGEKSLAPIDHCQKCLAQ